MEQFMETVKELIDEVERMRAQLVFKYREIKQNDDKLQ